MADERAEFVRGVVLRGGDELRFDVGELGSAFRRVRVRDDECVGTGDLPSGERVRDDGKVGEFAGEVDVALATPEFMRHAARSAIAALANPSVPYWPVRA